MLERSIGPTLGIRTELRTEGIRNLVLNARDAMPGRWRHNDRDLIRSGATRSCRTGVRRTLGQGFGLGHGAETVDRTFEPYSDQPALWLAVLPKSGSRARPEPKMAFNP
jgi:hypothetical protein